MNRPAEIILTAIALLIVIVLSAYIGPFLNVETDHFSASPIFASR